MTANRSTTLLTGDDCFLECASLGKSAGPGNWTQPALLDGRALWTDWDQDFMTLMKSTYGTLKIAELPTLYGGVLQAPHRVWAHVRQTFVPGERRVLDWTISEYVDACAAGAVSFYLANMALSTFPELRRRYRPENFPGRSIFQHSDKMSARELFIGAANTRYSSLHIDGMGGSVWCVCLTGEKEWIVFPPGDTKFLLPYRSPNQRDLQLRQSLLDPWDEQSCDHFASKMLHPVRVLQRAGDMLFLPPNWWHITRNNQVTVTINERVWPWRSLPTIGRWAWHTWCGRLTPGTKQPFTLY